MTQKMSRRTGKWGETAQKPFVALKAPKRQISATSRTADEGEPTTRVDAVKIAFHNIFDDRLEESILFLEARLIFGHKPIEIMEENPVEDGALWMSGGIDSWHSRNNSSRNRPGCKKSTLWACTPGRRREGDSLFPS